MPRLPSLIPPSSPSSHHLPGAQALPGLMFRSGTLSIRCELQRTLPTWTRASDVSSGGPCPRGREPCAGTEFPAGQRGLPGAWRRAGGLPSVGDYGVWVGALGPQAEMGEVFGRGSSSQEGVAVGCSLCQGMGRADGGRWRHREGAYASPQPRERGPHTGPHLSHLLWVLCLAWTGKVSR